MNKMIFSSRPETSIANQKQKMQPEGVVPTSESELTSQSKPEPNCMNGSVIRTTIDIPKKMHKAVKRLLLEENLSFKAYVIALIQQDFKSRGIEL